MAFFGIIAGALLLEPVIESVCDGAASIAAAAENAATSAHRKMRDWKFRAQQRLKRWQRKHKTE